MADHVRILLESKNVGTALALMRILTNHNNPADPAVASNEFRRDTTWKYSVDRFMVLQMILSHAYCLLVQSGQTFVKKDTTTQSQVPCTL